MFQTAHSPTNDQLLLAVREINKKRPRPKSMFVRSKTRYGLMYLHAQMRWRCCVFGILRLI